MNSCKLPSFQTCPLLVELGAGAEFAPVQWPAEESTHELCVTHSVTPVPATIGGLAQLVERVLSMHEVSGSIPEFSIDR